MIKIVLGLFGYVWKPVYGLFKAEVRQPVTNYVPSVHTVPSGMFRMDWLPSSRTTDNFDYRLDVNNWYPQKRKLLIPRAERTRRVLLLIAPLCRCGIVRLA